MSLNNEKAARLQRTLLIPAFFGTAAVFLFQTITHDIAALLAGNVVQGGIWLAAKYLYGSWIVFYVCTSYIVPSIPDNQYSAREFWLDTIESAAALLALAALGYADALAGEVAYAHASIAYIIALFAILVIALQGFARRDTGGRKTSPHVKTARTAGLILSVTGIVAIWFAEGDAAHMTAVLFGIGL